jgi:hypothetical protein
MDRSNHYESAFEGYLQEHRLCYVAIDEGRRAWLGESRVKNLDFIVHGGAGARLLVDVKGRRFPAGPPGKWRRVWECWSTREDVDGLLRWEALFGEGFRGLLVFAYQVLPGVDFLEEVPDLWEWHGRRYLLRAVAAADYRRAMRRRSPRWGTVFLPGPAFRELARPFQHFTHSRNVPQLEESPF